MARRMKQTAGIVGYLRVSTDEQASAGLGIAAQRAAIETEATRRQLPVIAWHEDAGVSGNVPAMNRPGLSAALNQLDQGNGSALLVAKLDRLSRSVHDATGVMKQAEKNGWALVAIDLGIDMTTPTGAAMAGVAAVFSELERRLISERTRNALAQKKAQGHRLGAKITLHESTRQLIGNLRADGLTYRAIVTELERRKLPTARGGTWQAATVKAVCVSLALDTTTT